MFGLSAKLLLISLLFTPLAHARKQTFISGSPLGIGFKAGLENKPKLDFVVDPQSQSSNYGNYFAFEPFFDFANVVILTSASLHYNPVFRSVGRNATGNFRETSDVTSFHYGAHVKLAPFFSQDMTRRLYLVLGFSQVVVTAKNNRTYTSGSTASWNEKIRGTGQELLYGVGFETFLVQNYSLELEAGYQSVSVGEFGYKSSRDITGATRNEGETAKSATTNRLKGFQQLGPYVSLALNLNF